MYFWYNEGKLAVSFEEPSAETVYITLNLRRLCEETFTALGGRHYLEALDAATAKSEKRKTTREAA
jgi:hypothetical protein